MWRTLFIASTTYALGHPACDGIRPEVLDVAVRAYYETVNEAAHDARGSLKVAMAKVGMEAWMRPLEAVAVVVSHNRTDEKRADDKRANKEPADNERKTP